MGSDSHSSGKKPPSDKLADNRPHTTQDAELTYVKKLREAGYERPEVTLDEMGSTSSGKQQPQSGSQIDKRPRKGIQDVALTYVKTLREAGCDRPKVALEEMGSNGSGRQIVQSAEHAGSRPRRNVQEAAGTCIRRLREAPIRYEPPKVALAERGTKTDEHIVVKECPAQASSSLPPRDSPLTKIFAGQYLSSLIEETIRYLKLSHNGLAQEMSIPEMVLRDAVQGKLGLTRGQWVKLGELLKMTTSFQLRPSERDGAPCWELFYPPVASIGH